MSNLFLFLWLVCLVALVVGLFKPQAVIRWGNENKRNRKSVLKFYGIGVVVLLILVGATAGNTDNVKETSKETKVSVSSKASEVDKKIDALGDIGNITLEKSSDVKAIRKEYESLKPDQKSNVTKLELLNGAEKKITELQSEADKVAAEKAAAEKAAAEKAAADKAAAEKAAAEKAAAEKAEAERVAYDTGITYDQLARTPDEFKGKKVKFSGSVVQVIEGKSQIDLRIAVNGDSNNILYVTYNPKITSTRVLENDYVTIKGVSKGIITYKSTLGGNISIPGATVDNITIGK